MVAPSGSGALRACGKPSSVPSNRARTTADASSHDTRDERGWQMMNGAEIIVAAKRRCAASSSRSGRTQPRRGALTCCGTSIPVAAAFLLLCVHHVSAFVKPSTPLPLVLRGGGKARPATAPAAFKFRVITTSQTKEKWCEDACSEYTSRIKKFGVGLEELTLKPAIGPPKQSEAQQKEEEGKNLLSHVDLGQDRLVLLDERGELLTSHQFADFLQRCADGGDRSVTFAIGGASGHSETVRNEAKAKGRMLSLGTMVMNHQIARVVLLEQIYRALTIQRGIPYHK